MRKISAFLSAALATATTFILQGTAWADFVRISNYSYQDLASVQKNRPENLRLHQEAPGLISVYFYSNPATGEGGVVSIWQTKEQAEAFYASEQYKNFVTQNVTPYVKEKRVIGIYQVDLKSP